MTEIVQLPRPVRRRFVWILPFWFAVASVIGSYAGSWSENRQPRLATLVEDPAAGRTIAPRLTCASVVGSMRPL